MGKRGRRKRVSVVFFDAGNTLLGINWPWIAGVMARHGFPAAADELDRLEHRARAHMDRAPQRCGGDDGSRWWWLFREVLRGAGVGDEQARESILAELWRRHREITLWDLERPGARRVLRGLAARGLAVGVISNSNGRLRHLLSLLHLDDLVDPVLDSHEEGVEKPDPEIFHRALRRVGIPPEAACYVGDLYHVDVVGARRAGMDAVLLDPFDLQRDRDCARIVELGDLFGVLGLSDERGA